MCLLLPGCVANGNVMSTWPVSITFGLVFVLFLFFGAFWKFRSNFAVKPVPFFFFVVVVAVAVAVVFFFYFIDFFNFTFFRRKLKVFVDLLEMYDAVQNGKIKYWTSWTQKQAMNLSIDTGDWIFNQILYLHRTARSIVAFSYQNIITSKQHVYLIFLSELMKKATTLRADWGAIHYFACWHMCALCNVLGKCSDWCNY